MKSIACIFGRHRWTIHDEHGAVCSRCGKLPVDPSSAAEFGKNFTDEPYVKQDDIGGAGGLRGGL